MEMILADYRWRVGLHGIGRFASEVLGRLPGINPVPAFGKPLHPLNPILLSAILWRLRPQVYFSPGFNPPLWSPTPVVFTIHDLIHLCCPGETSLAKQLYYRHVVRPAAYRAYRVLTVSTYIKHAILDWTGLPNERVVAVGNGVGAVFRPYGVRYVPGYPYIFYAGNRKPHKNLARLLRGFAHSGISRDVRLILTGPPDVTLSQQLITLKLQNRVMYAGELTDSELAAYYRGAMALVCPSFYEGFGLPPVEAMACGIPVVTSNCTALPEVVGDAALLIDPYDVEMIAWGIQCVVQDSTLRQALCQKGLERAQQFTWEQTATRVWQVLQAAAAQS
jgi:glycosyltransferase involved in cell wall biosynthesis